MNTNAQQLTIGQLVNVIDPESPYFGSQGEVIQTNGYMVEIKIPAAQLESRWMASQQLEPACAWCSGTGEDPVGMPGEPCPDCEGVSAAAARKLLEVGDTFNTPTEEGVHVLTLPDAHGVFLGRDRNGTQFPYNLASVTLIKGKRGETLTDEEVEIEINRAHEEALIENKQRTPRCQCDRQGCDKHWPGECSEPATIDVVSFYGVKAKVCKRCAPAWAAETEEIMRRKSGELKPDPQWIEKAHADALLEDAQRAGVCEWCKRELDGDGFCEDSSCQGSVELSQPAGPARTCCEYVGCTQDATMQLLGKVTIESCAAHLQSWIEIVCRDEARSAVAVQPIELGREETMRRYAAGEYKDGSLAPVRETHEQWKWYRGGHHLALIVPGGRQVLMVALDHVNEEPEEEDLAKIAAAPALARAVQLVLAMHDKPSCWVPGFAVHLDPKAEEQLRGALAQYQGAK
jgi:hypothetical protein